LIDRKALEPSLKELYADGSTTANHEIQKEDKLFDLLDKQYLFTVKRFNLLLEDCPLEVL
jgi:hypothetical protein